ncbi:hypothetical protein [Burkholderia sp. TSV86]|uniref:hypothetical protein n=1 Tax=Burkholderia sp. TSV86 TaxID=1385594 RepID=UPI00075D5ABF|nr:hypothetical protein [Burkholderia sp. TSV86]KVE32712.1 hypothetical protein WS68_16480 [Burkholderia sp. TSV86]
MDAITEASRRGNFAVSFRKAGEATIARLKEGAAAKGHDILEKTIKSSSLEKAYGQSDGAEKLEMARRASIEGYVGQWEGNKLTGIYMSSKSTVGNQRTPRSGPRILPIDMDNSSSLENALRPLKQQTNWKSLPFTGDYDMHDMIQFGGAGPAHTVASNSREESLIISRLNKAVARVDPLRRGQSKEYDVVRHGPQVNYPAFRMAEEGSFDLVGVVARPEFPVAIVSKGKWAIAEDLEELEAFYRGAGVHIKESWRSGGSRYFEKKKNGSSGSVELARSRSERTPPFGMRRPSGRAFWDKG